jgi:hypothetical protein
MIRLVLSSGPSGSGKTTVARKVAEWWPHTCVLLDFDRQRTFVKAGYAEPSYGWNDECECQWALARDVIAAVIPLYVGRDVDVVVHAYANVGDYDLWQAAFGDVAYRTFVLLPTLAAVIERNNGRCGAAKVTEADVRNNYAAFLSWRITPGIGSVMACPSRSRYIHAFLHCRDVGFSQLSVPRGLGGVRIGRSGGP